MADQQASVTLEKPVAGGRTLARLDGRVVLVSGGIPGERVRVSFERTSKGVAFARVIEVEEPSSDRVLPEHDAQCGGLVFAHVAYPRQLLLKQAIVEDALHRIGRLQEVPSIEGVGSPVREWRMRARLHVRGRRLGFYREGTHSLCDAEPSGQLAPGLLEAARGVVDRLREELTGHLDAVVATETAAGDQRAVHLELTRPLPRQGEPFRGPIDGMTGVSAGLAGSRHPAIVAGHPWVRESLVALGVAHAGASGLLRHAAAFFQGNRALLPPLVQHVLGRVTDGPIVDLYAGVGLFGVAAASAGAADVACVEGDAISAEDLVANVLPFGPRVRAIRGDVETFVRQEAAALEGACVIVDPPRTGLSPVVSDAIASAKPRRVIYVSCDPATLARDLQKLVAAGLRVASAVVFDMFPVTAHVETVVELNAER